MFLVASLKTLRLVKFGQNIDILVAPSKNGHLVALVDTWSQFFLARNRHLGLNQSKHIERGSSSLKVQLQTPTRLAQIVQKKLVAQSRNIKFLKCAKSRYVFFSVGQSRSNFSVAQSFNMPILSRNRRQIPFCVAQSSNISVLDHAKLRELPGSQKVAPYSFWVAAVAREYTFFGSRKVAEKFFNRVKLQHNHFESQWSQRTWLGSQWSQHTHFESQWSQHTWLGSEWSQNTHFGSHGSQHESPTSTREAIAWKNNSHNSQIWLVANNNLNYPDRNFKLQTPFSRNEFELDNCK